MSDAVTAAEKWKNRLDLKHATAEGMYQAERYKRDEAEKEVADLLKRNDRLKRKVSRLLAVIEAAPHGEDCRMLELGYDNCWKGNA